MRDYRGVAGPAAESEATDRSQAGFDNQLGASTELRDAIFGAKTFGASAPLRELLVKFRFTGDDVYVHVATKRA